MTYVVFHYYFSPELFFTMQDLRFSIICMKLWNLITSSNSRWFSVECVRLTFSSQFSLAWQQLTDALQNRCP